MRIRHFAILVLGSFGCSEPDSSVKVVNSIPQALITSHPDGATLNDGDTVTFSGGGSDADDVASDLEGLWQTGSDTLCDWATLGEGGTTACVATVSVGMSDVNLVVRDPGEAVGSARQPVQNDMPTKPARVRVLAGV